MKVPEGVSYTRPYWHRNDPETETLNTIDNPQYLTLPFAPNPFHGVCTLACCKPRVRKKAKVGDYVLGMGAAKPKLQGHLVYWMRVDKIV